MMQDDDDVDVAEASSLTKLDSCTVQVDPPMTAAMERLRLPDNLMKQLGIGADVTPTGLVLTGENASCRPYGSREIHTVGQKTAHFLLTVSVELFKRK